MPNCFLNSLLNPVTLNAQGKQSIWTAQATLLRTSSWYIPPHLPLHDPQLFLLARQSTLGTRLLWTLPLAFKAVAVRLLPLCLPFPSKTVKAVMQRTHVLIDG